MSENDTTVHYDDTGDGIQTDTTHLSYDPATETYRTEHDWDAQEPLTTTLATAIAAATNVQPNDLPALFDTADPESLDGLFEPITQHDRGRGRVTFPYADFHVTIRASGEITFEPFQTSPEAPSDTGDRRHSR